MLALAVTLFVSSFTTVGIQCDGYYCMTYTTNDNITLLRSRVLTDWHSAEKRLLFQPLKDMNYSTDIWGPELHGNWYAIFTADPNHDSPPPEVDMYYEESCPAVHHRMFVFEGLGSDPWVANFSFKAQLNTYDQFPIDGTYLQHKSGLYHVYNCWYREFDGWPANLYITKSMLQLQVTRSKAGARPSVGSLDYWHQSFSTPNPLRSYQPLRKDAIWPSAQRPSLLQRSHTETHQPFY
ncbi:uncharacterized protein BDR25DRAFT_364760 [Lindgomyces ingoldianus]|uniref:Uncharacterized protein n=1 Tax=Lindgomyces ingoldianus TaxID=673940 RepID=A0ACB6RGZ7_9PLEO|nr:uncharacterized protein BDR25DRAFT_364760 [Lindgomyces ingoldianus]KAF2477792.1 hypothetical protein BDR25DRAFT_364760 [Lindgomyces ingoldianus]